MNLRKTDLFLVLRLYQLFSPRKGAGGGRLHVDWCHEFDCNTRINASADRRKKVLKFLRGLNPTRQNTNSERDIGEKERRASLGTSRPGVRPLLGTKIAEFSSFPEKKVLGARRVQNHNMRHC